MAATFISAVLIYTADVERLVAFYRDVLGLPLEREQHGETLVHFGCELGDTHFAIHPATTPTNPAPRSNVTIALGVDSVERVVSKIAVSGFSLLYAPEEVGFAKMTAILDPDGNYIELTQLSTGWYSHLRSRRDSPMDPLFREDSDI